MFATRYADCPTCGEVHVVEAPPCLDGHGVDCADRCCVECGTGLVVDPVLPRVHHETVRHAA